MSLGLRVSREQGLILGALGHVPEKSRIRCENDCVSFRFVADHPYPNSGVLDSSLVVDALGARPSGLAVCRHCMATRFRLELVL
jgi:hypothetical protein